MNDSMTDQHAAANPMQGYFDWQVNTLMLAYDLGSPVRGDDADGAERRRRSVENEVRTLTLAIVPDIYQEDPELAWPPEVMMDITRATLLRAAEVAGVVGV